MANNTPDILDPRTLLLDVEKLANANLVQWSASLNFEMDKDALGELEKYDICQFIGQYKGEVKFQLYFDRNKYKPPPMDCKKISPEYMAAFNELKNDIERAGAETGSSVIANGSRGNGARQFCCGRFRRYQPGKAVIASDTNRDYRQDSIVDCDKAGRRPSGRAKARRTRTSKAHNGQSCCPFKFVIDWDEKGYYLIQTSGNHRHVGHPKTDKISIATRLLKEEKEELHPNLGNDILKHDYNELLIVLKTYETEYPERNMTDKVRTMMNDYTNKMRADLRHEVNNKKKRAADGTSQIVNIKSETRNKSARRMMVRTVKDCI
jgi:hypothetical protein